jgi:hypothetical protein
LQTVRSDNLGLTTTGFTYGFWHQPKINITLKSHDLIDFDFDWFLHRSGCSPCGSPVKLLSTLYCALQTPYHLSPKFRTLSLICPHPSGMSTSECTSPGYNSTSLWRSTWLPQGHFSTARYPVSNCFLQVPRSKSISLILCKCHASVKVFVTIRSLVCIYHWVRNHRIQRTKGNSYKT